MSLPVNIVDLAVIGILLISAVLAFARGFTREVLSIVGWIGAGAAVWYLLPYLRPVARRYVDNTLIADVATAIVIFVVTLVLLSILFGFVANRVRDSGVNALDRSLGFLFGLARGAALVALVYLILVQFVPSTDHPEWLREARSLPVIRQSAMLLAGLAPAEIAEGLKVAADGATSPPTVTGMGPPDRLAPENMAPDSRMKSGYKAEDRKQLDRLIGTSQDR